MASQLSSKKDPLAKKKKIKWPGGKDVGLLMRLRHKGVPVTVEEESAYIDHIADIPDMGPAATHSNRGPQGTRCEYQGIVFDSKWEYIFYRYNKDLKGLVVERNKTDFLPYTDETGKRRKFYYDFRVNGLPYEVKGILRPADACKMNQCPNVQFVFGDEINAMKKELDKHLPNWPKDFKVLKNY